MSALAAAAAANEVPTIPTSGVVLQTATGSEGSWSSWGACPKGMHIVGFRARTQGYTSNADNSGLNDLEVICRDTGVPVGANAVSQAAAGGLASVPAAQRQPTQETVVRFGMHDNMAPDDFSAVKRQEELKAAKLVDVAETSKIGGWGVAQVCPKNGYVCGIQTRVLDASQAITEDSIGQGAGKSVSALAAAAAAQDSALLQAESKVYSKVAGHDGNVLQAQMNLLGKDGIGVADLRMYCCK